MSLGGRPSNREHRHHMRSGEVEVIVHHCEDCGAPFCPTCDQHTDWCPDCGAFHCDGHGSWFPVSPFFEVALN